MIIVKAPLRISFLGGSTDIKDFYSKEDGVCLGSAINKYVYVILQKRFQENICIGYTEKEYASSVKEIKHDLVREAMLSVDPKIKSLEISTLADIPSKGSGLGSSSSLLTALLKALYIHKGAAISNKELAEQACAIEIDHLKRPIGKQDQYWSSFGGLNLLLFKKKEVQVKSLDFSAMDLIDFENHFLLFHTGISRDSGDILKTIKNTQEIFDFKKRLKDLAYKGYELLKARHFDTFGELLDKGWRIKRTLSSDITNPLIDKMYHEGLKLGALGGKLLGAGGGGFLLFFCPPEKQILLRKNLQLVELPFKFDCLGTREVFNDAPFENLYQKFKPQTGKNKLRHIAGIAECVQKMRLDGDIAEFGVFRGGAGLILSSIFPEKTVHLFDTFEGIPDLAITEVEKEYVGQFNLSSRLGFSTESTFEAVKDRFKGRHAAFHKGLFSETCLGAENEKFCFVYLDADLHVSTKQGIAFFYSRMVKGGILAFDDWGFPGVKQAIKEFMKNKPEKIKVDSTNIAIIEKE